MDGLIERLRLSESLERDLQEAEHLIILASDFASRDRPRKVVDGLFKQMLEVAASACAKSQAQGADIDRDSPFGKLAAALLEGTWECSIVRNDVGATTDRFATNLSLLISKWPKLAAVSQIAVTNLIQRLPLSEQRGFWRAALICRAWS